MQLNESNIDLFARMIAQQVVKILAEGKNESEYCSVKEAAAILGISTEHMRKLKSKFPHIKSGNHQQGRLLFKKNDLIKNFMM